MNVFGIATLTLFLLPHSIPSVWGADKYESLRATPEIESSAKQGDHVAQTRLGLTYLFGVKEARSNAKAIYWLKQASVKNYGPAEYLLGMIFLADKNDTPRVQEGGRYLMRSAEHGCAGAAGLLGVMFLTGAQKYQDEKQELGAIKYIRQAAEGGDYMSQNLMAKLYSTGTKTIPKDLVVAQAWLEYARIEHPHHKFASVHDLNVQLEQLNEDDLERAKELAIRFKRQYAKKKYELCSQTIPDEALDAAIDMVKSMKQSPR